MQQNPQEQPQNQPQQQVPQQPYTATSSAAAKNKNRGIMFILLPFGLLALSFILILINSIIAGMTGSKDGILHVIINVIAFALGGIGAIGFVPFLILGIVYILKK